MLKRWILYLLTVSICIVFYLAYRQWFAWFALICVLCLPIVALLTSLPAMLKLKLKAKYPPFISVGTKQSVHFVPECRFPTPPCRYRLRVTRAISGEEWKLKEGKQFPTEHCGKMLCKLENTRVYDYMGLFWLRIQKKSAKPLVIRPVPVPMQYVPDLERFAASSWRPKAGGGFSENHEMRQYVPGDKLNQVHWKLTAKTGEIIVREPMEPERNRVLIEMELRGTPDQLDRKFGQLLWLSQHLLEMGLKHELRVLTGDGVQNCRVENAEDLDAAVDYLLGQKMASTERAMEAVAAAWCCRIGGGEDEA